MFETAPTEPSADTTKTAMPVAHPADASRTVVPDSFAFVMNVGHLTEASSYNIAPGHELRRATKAEIAVIKDVINRHGPAPRSRYTSLWERRWPHPGGRIEILSEPDWRYFVIAFKGARDIMSGLGAALDLAPLELEIGFTVVHWELEDPNSYGVACNAGRLFHVLEHTHLNAFFGVGVSRQDVETIQQIHAHLQQHDHRVIDVRRLVTQLGQLKGFPYRSPLRFLGYFAILESLLTHAPKPSDPYDSITRQVQKKLILLDHRWPHPIDYTPFDGAKPETVWSRMYSYRSLVVHGGEPEFTRELSILKNEEVAMNLIKETVKAVVRQALAEPQLLVDVREC